jgi:hypothetical protein
MVLVGHAGAQEHHRGPVTDGIVREAAANEYSVVMQLR